MAESERITPVPTLSASETEAAVILSITAALEEPSSAAVIPSAPATPTIPAISAPVPTVPVATGGILNVNRSTSSSSLDAPWARILCERYAVNAQLLARRNNVAESLSPADEEISTAAPPRVPSDSDTKTRANTDTQTQGSVVAATLSEYEPQSGVLQSGLAVSFQIADIPFGESQTTNDSTANFTESTSAILEVDDYVRVAAELIATGKITNLEEILETGTHIGLISTMYRTRCPASVHTAVASAIRSLFFAKNPTHSGLRSASQSQSQTSHFASNSLSPTKVGAANPILGVSDTSPNSSMVAGAPSGASAFPATPIPSTLQTVNSLGGQLPSKTMSGVAREVPALSMAELMLSNGALESLVFRLSMLAPFLDPEKPAIADVNYFNMFLKSDKELVACWNEIVRAFCTMILLYDEACARCMDAKDRNGVVLLSRGAVFDENEYLNISLQQLSLSDRKKLEASCFSKRGDCTFVAAAALVRISHYASPVRSTEIVEHRSVFDAFQLILEDPSQEHRSNILKLAVINAIGALAARHKSRKLVKDMNGDMILRSAARIASQTGDYDVAARASIIAGQLSGHSVDSFGFLVPMEISETDGDVEIPRQVDQGNIDARLNKLALQMLVPPHIHSHITFADTPDAMPLPESFSKKPLKPSHNRRASLTPKFLPSLFLPPGMNPKQSATTEASGGATLNLTGTNPSSTDKSLLPLDLTSPKKEQDSTLSASNVVASSTAPAPTEEPSSNHILANMMASLPKVSSLAESPRTEPQASIVVGLGSPDNVASPSSRNSSSQRTASCLPRARYSATSSKHEVESPRSEAAAAAEPSAAGFVHFVNATSTAVGQQAEASVGIQSPLNTSGTRAAYANNAAASSSAEHITAGALPKDNTPIGDEQFWSAVVTKNVRRKYKPARSILYFTSRNIQTRNRKGKLRSIREFRMIEVPRSQRTPLWEILLNVEDSLRTVRYGDFNELKTGSLAVDDIATIEADVTRTMPLHCLFWYGGARLGVDSLKNVLIAYAKNVPEVGYCQGMSSLAAIILIHSRSEERAYVMFSELMRVVGFHDFFLPQFPALWPTLSEFKDLVARFLPEVMSHLDACDLAVNLFADKWFLTALTYNFPHRLLFRLWDIMLLERSVKIITRAGLAVLKLSYPTIKTFDFEKTFTYLQSGFADPKRGILADEEMFIATAYSFRFARKNKFGAAAKSGQV